MKRDFGCDLLVISPHTDDLEIGCGGMVAALAAQGKHVWAVDLTRGELGSNATVAERWSEAGSASEILGLAGRLQLELPDGFLRHDPDQKKAVIWAIRALRPRWIVSAPDPRRHPDHVVGAQLIKEAAFLSRLTNLSVAEPAHHVWAGGERPGEGSRPWKAEAVFHVCAVTDTPGLLFDISAHWETKRRSLEAYASQFRRGESRVSTHINNPEFLEHIEHRARIWGQRAGCRYAEALGGDAVAILSGMPEGRWE